MCDTVVALPPATAAGAVLFAKNSDRERNEAQAVEMIAGADHPARAELACTYITIPQARRTLPLLICRPFWMWGAEMGANSAGVVIGNEAVHATIPAQRGRALTGMDLVRLALERGENAAEAVEVVTSLLRRHGQGGDCGHRRRFYYHNSFLIADHREAYVLETVGRSWALERATGVRAISNALSIRGDAAHLSDDLAARGASFDFAATFSDPSRDEAGCGTRRRRRAEQRLALARRADGPLGVASMIAVLRDHGPEGEAADWAPHRTVGRSICMHAGDGERRSQTVGSLVSDLGEGGRQPVHWVTASAAPCLSLFKPVVLGLPPPWRDADSRRVAPAPSDRYDPEARWWRGEPWRRACLNDYPPALATIAPERDRLEARFREQMAEAARRDSPAQLARAARACWREADAMEGRWSRHGSTGDCVAPTTTRPPSDFRRSWTSASRWAGLPSGGRAWKAPAGGGG